MSRPPIREVQLNDSRMSLHLCHRDSERPAGFWLYDKDACGGMNIAMAAPSEIEALVKAIRFWKNRAQEAEEQHAMLFCKVENFMNSVKPNEEDS